MKEPAPEDNPLLDDIAEILVAAEALQGRVAELGAAISHDYAGLNPLLVGVLKGCTFFMADLIRAITIPVAVDFIAITSYGPATRSTGVVRFMKDLETSVEGRHVLVVEDIIDTGLTLNYILRVLRGRHPASLEVGTLLDKPARRLPNIKLRYRGFELPDKFVVGYGLDFQQLYRNLPFIGALKGK
jgi:hypoxanthine phosphoribosyltransferase